MDSSSSSEKSDDEEDDEFDVEIDEEDEDINNLDASMSYEFTKFLDDPKINVGASKNTLIGSKKTVTMDL